MNMDIFRLATDSSGVFNTRNERRKTACSCHSDNLQGGDITDSAVLSGRFKSRVPTYKAGLSLTLPYSERALPRQSSFGNFFWNHAPAYQGSVFEGQRRPNTTPPAVRGGASLESHLLQRPIVASSAPKTARHSPQPFIRRTASTRTPLSGAKPDIFAGHSITERSSTDWDGLWQN